MNFSSPPESDDILAYRRRITGKTWILAGLTGAGFALFGLWNWTLGIFFGLCVGMINFFLLARQTARLAARAASAEKSKGVMVTGHWMRYLLIGTVTFLVYKKSTISFPAFLVGMMLVYLAIFVDAFQLRFKSGPAQES
ncbi:MAG: ATP synthase subunit I [Candidatus Omnitrophica bacterium]|nr:ATP synthase subunit I [Candidatus Omnitrophota bacterium]